MHKPDFRLSARRLAVPADLAALDALIGANCLTLLAWRRWREDYRVR